jgi:hypothetical protein
MQTDGAHVQRLEHMLEISLGEKKGNDHCPGSGCNNDE